MFTIFHALTLTCAATGLFWGGVLGFHYYGILGCLVGAVFGLVGGYLIGRIPTIVITWLANLHLWCLTTERLQAELRGGISWAGYMKFAELVRRGEDVSQYVRVVLPKLVCDCIDERRLGIALLSRAFPELAQKLTGYDPRDSTDTCKRKLLEAGIMMDSPGLNSLNTAE